MSKELPQEVRDRLIYFSHRHYQPAAENIQQAYKDGLEDGAGIAWQYAQKEMSGYRLSAENDAELLEANDKEIVELKAMNDKLKRLLKDLINNQFESYGEQWGSHEVQSHDEYVKLCKEHGIEP